MVTTNNTIQPMDITKMVHSRQMGPYKNLGGIITVPELKKMITAALGENANVFFKLDNGPISLEKLPNNANDDARGPLFNFILSNAKRIKMAYTVPGQVPQITIELSQNSQTGHYSCRLAPPAPIAKV